MSRFLGVCLVLLSATAAWAKAIPHLVTNGETIESIAADYYGNRALAFYVREVNGIAPGTPLKAGQTVQIPTAFRYRLKKGDTFDLLAGRLLFDKRRAPLLFQFNGLKPGDKGREGQEITIPFHVNHRVGPGETLDSLAKQFYGDASKAKLIAEYNFRAPGPLKIGDRVFIPVSNVRIRSVRLETGEKGAGAVPQEGLRALSSKEIERREAQLAEKIGVQLRRIETAYQQGNYQEIPGALDRILTDQEPSEAQLAELFRLKAFAYVALGLDEPAVDAFREVVERRPDLVLDEATVSPKIRAALERAKAPRGGPK